MHLRQGNALPITRTNKKKEVEQVRFTEAQFRAMDVLVDSGIYGTTRSDVIRFYVVQGLAEYDKQGRLSGKKKR